MLKKLQSYYPTSILLNLPPQSSFDQFFWIKDNHDEPIWLGIPKNDIQDEQLELLSTLFEVVDSKPSFQLTEDEKKWKKFLFHEGTPPTNTGNEIRLIHYHISTTKDHSTEWEKALQEFFLDSPFIQIDEGNGIIILEKTDLSYGEDDFYSISTTLENDFFIRIEFYIGKMRTTPQEIRESFFLERELFIEGLTLLGKERIFTYEKIFPSLSAVHLPAIPKKLLETDVIDFLRKDPELLETMKVFLENNSNTSLAAKKLYIHRNTLQYRLEKFTELTGINVKTFNSAVTIYLACLMAERPKW
jgi:DNA-binding PucR family transcriptional regulator